MNHPDNITSPLPECVGVIPARFSSTRFPGKPLVKILGRPMFWHVYTRAVRCPEMGRVVLATDDARIASAAESLNVPVVMTRSDHSSGTDRVLEAVEILGVSEDTVVVNIQGDEPALDPAMLGELVRPFRSPEIRVTTLARRIKPDQAGSPDQVKVVFDRFHRALYFSRSLIPFSRDGGMADYYGHIGLYAFRKVDLECFVRFGPSRLERTEKLEQLRLLENGIPIHVVETHHVSAGVDRPEDLERVARLMTASGVQ